MDEATDSQEAKALSALDAAIAQLYTTFACYPVGQVRTRDGAPCPDQRLLESRPLAQLDWHELGRYAFKAVSFWGDTDDFRHFLPRLLDLLAQDPPHLGEEILAATIGRVWRAWPAEEQRALARYFAALWRYVLATFATAGEHGVPEDTLCCVAQVVDDLTPYLDAWEQARSPSALCYLAHIVLQNSQTLARNEGLENPAWSARKAQMQRVVSWLLGPRSIALLQEGYEAYATAPFADELEDAATVLGALRAKPVH